MHQVTVATDLHRQLRQEDLAKAEKRDVEEHKEARKNRGFTQIYPRGWKRTIELVRENPSAFELYAFFAEHLDPTCGAVVCDQQFLANQMKVSTRTIRRWLDYLENKEALVRIPVAGKVCAYALDLTKFEGLRYLEGLCSFCN